jgi:hypothetical protein
MRSFFVFMVLWIVLAWQATAQTQLEEDEGLGQYDYLCLTDSTWVHWSTDWAVWSTAEVSVTLPDETSDFPSEWKHDMGGRKHLSTISQVSSQHFPSSSYQPGYPISLVLKLDGMTQNTYSNEMMLFNVVKQDISGYIYNTSKQLVLQFYIDIGSMSGNRMLTGMQIKNIGSLQEGDGDRDIGYDGLRLYYETGSAFDFDGSEAAETLWGDWAGDSKYNNEWKNLLLSITIPAGQRLYCYVVIENFSPTVTLGRTAQFELVLDGLWMDNYGTSHKYKARIDARTNSQALPLVESSFSLPGIVVSSYYNASDPRDEWTEMLVVTDNLDLRNYSLRDNNTDQDSWQTEIAFQNIDFWNHLRAGTIIRLWHRPVNSAGTAYSQDESKADGYIELVLNNTNYFTGGSFGTAPSWAGASMNIGGNGDIIQIRDNTSNHVHALAHKSTPGSDYNSLPLPKLCHTDALSSDQTLSICPGSEINEYGVYDPREGSSYTFKENGSVTIGLPNTCTASSSANEDYWRSLRQPRWINPTGSGSYAPGNTEVHLSWNTCEDACPNDNLTGYIILRNTENTFLAPTDGTSYTVGNYIGSAVITGIVIGSQTTSFTDPNPAPCDGVVYYRIYAFRFSQDENQGNSYHQARGTAYNETEFATISVNGPTSPNTSLIWHY